MWALTALMSAWLLLLLLLLLLLSNTTELKIKRYPSSDWLLTLQIVSTTKRRTPSGTRCSLRTSRWSRLTTKTSWPIRPPSLWAQVSSLIRLVSPHTRTSASIENSFIRHSHQFLCLSPLHLTSVSIENSFIRHSHQFMCLSSLHPFSACVFWFIGLFSSAS